MGLILLNKDGKVELINKYAECEDYTQTVYGYVPIEIVEELIEKHGGFKPIN